MKSIFRKTCDIRILEKRLFKSYKKITSKFEKTYTYYGWTSAGAGSTVQAGYMTYEGGGEFWGW